MGYNLSKKFISNKELRKLFSGKSLRDSGQIEYIGPVLYIVPLSVFIPPAAFPGSADLICVARAFVAFASHSRLA